MRANPAVFLLTFCLISYVYVLRKYLFFRHSLETGLLSLIFLGEVAVFQEVLLFIGV